MTAPTEPVDVAVDSEAWSSTVRQRAIETMVSAVPGKLAEQDPDSGRFLTDQGAWAVTRQDVMFPLAYLWHTEHDRNPYHRDDAVIIAIQQAGRALLDHQDDDGQVEFVKTDGSTWGPIYMPWTMYHWLEAYALIREALPAEDRDDWAAGLQLAFAGIHDELDDAEVHNIPVWNAMSLHRAGRLFDRPDWSERGQDFLLEAVQSQDPAGFWPEHGGPTPNYNRVYVHALGCYHAHTGDESVLGALRRAIDFHVHFTYPDGAAVETIDGRVKYHDDAKPNGLPGFLATTAGRRYADTYLLRGHRDDWGLSPHLASACQTVSSSPVEQSLDVSALTEDRPARYRRTYHDLAIVRRQDPWFTCLSGVTTSTTAERWGMDRQQFVSVWHERAGLIIGGGNSKEQPRWSTFCIGPDPNESTAGETLPTEAALEAADSGDVVTLDYDGHRASLTLTPRSTHTMALTAEWQSSGATDSAWWQLPLWIGPESSIAWGPAGSHRGSFHQRLDANTLQGPVWLTGDRYREGDVDSPPVGDGPPFRLWVDDAWALDLPAGSVVTWPSRPFNPYASDGRAPVTDAIGVAIVPLDAEPVTCRVHVEPP